MTWEEDIEKAKEIFLRLQGKHNESFVDLEQQQDAEQEAEVDEAVRRAEAKATAEAEWAAGVQRRAAAPEVPVRGVAERRAEQEADADEAEQEVKQLVSLQRHRLGFSAHSVIFESRAAAADVRELVGRHYTGGGGHGESWEITDLKVWTSAEEWVAHGMEQEAVDIRRRTDPEWAEFKRLRKKFGQ